MPRARPGAAPVTEPDEPTELQQIEIKEYEGKDLSSVEDFRENSIKGPQEVDIADIASRSRASLKRHSN